MLQADRRWAEAVQPEFMVGLGLFATVPMRLPLSARHLARRLLQAYPMKCPRTHIRKIRADEGDRAVAIWRSSVEATHDFLLPGDIDKLDTLVCGFLPQAPLWVATDEVDRPIGFMG